MGNTAIIKSLDDLERKYNDYILLLGFHHLLDVGARNLTEENVKKAKEEITEKDAAANGKSIMTPEFASAIVECAAELSRLDPSALWRNAYRYLPNPDKYNVQPIPLDILRTMDWKPAFIVTNDEYKNRWRIIRMLSIVCVENAPMNEDTYGKNWVAYDHEPPREVIEEWLYSLQTEGEVD